MRWIFPAEHDNTFFSSSSSRKNPLSITINAGSTKSHWFDPELRYGRDVQFRAVKRVVIYPRFNHINYASYNIALLEVSEPFVRKRKSSPEFEN